jgi:hypothetical protein
MLLRGMLEARRRLGGLTFLFLSLTLSTLEAFSLRSRFVSRSRVDSALPAVRQLSFGARGGIRRELALLDVREALVPQVLLGRELLEFGQLLRVTALAQQGPQTRDAPQSKSVSLFLLVQRALRSLRPLRRAFLRLTVLRRLPFLIGASSSCDLGCVLGLGRWLLRLPRFACGPPAR